MAEFQWWLLIVGLVAGGGLVAVILMDGSRREADLLDDERAAEATWIARWLGSEGRPVAREDVELILRAHRDYLTLPPPDRLEPAAPEPAALEPMAPQPADAEPASDGDADRAADQVRDDGRGGADQDLASA